MNESKRRHEAGRAKLAERQRANRDERLLAALHRLQEQGMPLGQREIAAEAGASLSTVKRSWILLYETIATRTAKTACMG